MSLLSWYGEDEEGFEAFVAEKKHLQDIMLLEEREAVSRWPPFNVSDSPGRLAGPARAAFTFFFRSYAFVSFSALCFQKK